MIRLAVRCRPDLAERVLADLLELAPGGVEEDRGDDWVEYAIYGPPGEIPSLPDLEAAAGEGLVEVSSTEIPDDWADRWRDFHRPVVIGDRLVVRPSWGSSPSAPGRVEVTIDPGQAFGTGAHATTSLCLELLLELADAGEARGPLADLGTGSGVLAIAAAKLGWSPVSGYDSERAAIDAAADNARANGVEIELTRLNVREHPAPEVPTIVANLTAALLQAVVERFTVAPLTLVCSGLLTSEADAVSAALASRGLEVAERRRQGDWTALLCRSPAAADRH